MLLIPLESLWSKKSPTHLARHDCDYTHDSVWAVNGEDDEDDESHLAHPSPSHPGSRWGWWGLCSSVQGWPGAARGRLEARPGRPSQTGLRPRGCEPASGTEDPTGRWRCWHLKVGWGTGCGPEWSGRSTCSEGRPSWGAQRLSLDLCSAGQREERHMMNEN